MPPTGKHTWPSVKVQTVKLTTSSPATATKPSVAVATTPVVQRVTATLVTAAALETPPVVQAALGVARDGYGQRTRLREAAAGACALAHVFPQQQRQSNPSWIIL